MVFLLEINNSALQIFHRYVQGWLHWSCRLIM